MYASFLFDNSQIRNGGRMEEQMAKNLPDELADMGKEILRDV